MNERERLSCARDHFLEAGRVLQQLAVQRRLVDEGAQNAGLVLLFAEAREEVLESDELFQIGQETAAGDVPLGVLRIQLYVFDGQVREILVQGRLILEVTLPLAFLYFEQRRLCDVDVAAVDELDHLAIEEREQ